MDRLTGLNLSSSPKKGCLFGKSHASDVAWTYPQENIINYSAELLTSAPFSQTVHLSAAIPNL